MRTRFLLNSLFIASLLLASCGTFVGEKMLHVRKGATMGEVSTADNDLVDKLAVVITGDGLESKAVYHLIISEMKAAGNENYWIYAFKDNKLFYWGYPYQFKRHEDNEIRIFGEYATQYMVKQELIKATKQ